MKFMKKVMAVILSLSVLFSGFCVSHAGSVSKVTFKNTSKSFEVDSKTDKVKIDWRKVSNAKKYIVHIRNLSNDKVYKTSSKNDYYKLDISKLDIKKDCKIRCWVQAVSKYGGALAQGQAIYSIDVEFDIDSQGEIVDEINYNLEKAAYYLEKAEEYGELANASADVLLEDTVELGLATSYGEIPSSFYYFARGAGGFCKTGKETSAGLYYIYKAYKHAKKAQKLERKLREMMKESAEYAQVEVFYTTG